MVDKRRIQKSRSGGISSPVITLEYFAMRFDRAALSAACFEWLDRPELHQNAIAGTLTFRPSLTIETPKGLVRFRLNEDHAKSAVRHYLQRLDVCAYGKDASRRGKRLGAIPIREGGSGLGQKHIHYHLQLQVPEHQRRFKWMRVARKQWERLDWASPEQNVFTSVEDSGWLSYILKQRDKPDFLDAVDFENLRIN